MGFFCYKVFGIFVLFNIDFIYNMARLQTIRLHADIKKEFDRLSAIKEHGVTKYSTPYIISAIALKFYKSPKTIENIVFNRTNIEMSAQSSLNFG